jgi:tetratricopeptide (TPR) repeat protein
MNPSVTTEVSGWLLGAGLWVATFLAYAPALSAGFIWNDSEYVTAPALRSVEGFWRIWFELGATEQYYPLLHSAFWLQHQIWGDVAAGYHVFNVALHATAACLLAAVLRRLAVPGAWLAAGLFALHPVAVESVAWISEQKNTLSLVFYLTAALLYLRFTAERGPRVYAAATLCFAAALLSKSVTASLPAALLVVTWWRHGRIEWRRDVVPLLPWFALGGAMALVSAHVERVYIGAHGEEFALTALQRSLLAGRIAWFYLGKLLWPADLIFIYPRWNVDPGVAWQWAFSLGALALLAILWRLRRWSRAPLAAVLFFGGSLVPTLGFFNVYAFLYSYVADHWQYLPGIGVHVLLAAGLTLALRDVVPAGRFRIVVPGLLLAGLGALSWQQSRMYADMRTFYVTTLERNPAAWMAHNNLGSLLHAAGDRAGARRHFEAALRVRPGLFKAHFNLGNILREQGFAAEALEQYRRAIELKPDYVEALNQLGSLLRSLRQPHEALPHLFAAVRLDPAFADARNNLGMALRDAGRLTDALRQFERAVQDRPDMAPAHLNLALTLSLVGRTDEAMHHFRTARRLNPAIPDLPMK